MGSSEPIGARSAPLKHPLHLCVDGVNYVFVSITVWGTTISTTNGEHHCALKYTKGCVRQKDAASHKDCGIKIFWEKLSPDLKWVAAEVTNKTQDQDTQLWLDSLKEPGNVENFDEFVNTLPSRVI